MDTLKTLSKKIKGTRRLLSVVKTMKTLAAVNIRQFEKTVESLEEYNSAVEKGMVIALKNKPQGLVLSEKEAKKRLGVVLFGSEQGLSGGFNRDIAEYTADRLSGLEREEYLLLSIGNRPLPYLKGREIEVIDCLEPPGSASGISDSVRELSIIVENWRKRNLANRIVLFFNRPEKGASYEPGAVSVIPIKAELLERLESSKWKGNSLPAYSIDWNTLFSGLVREYIFLSLYRAFAESLAAENAARLASMRSAENSIEEHLEDLKTRHNRRRQNAITSELMDIVSGFEILAGESRE